MKTLGYIIILLLLLFIPPATALELERIDLGKGVSMILTRPQETYYIVNLINENSFNVTLVEGIEVGFPQKIDPSLVWAVDNHNNSVTPDKIGSQSIVLTYNGTIPAGGYGKIFIDLDRPKPTPRPSPVPTTTLPPPTTTLSTLPATTTTLTIPVLSTSTPVPTTSPNPHPPASTNLSNDGNITHSVEAAWIEPPRWVIAVTFLVLVVIFGFLLLKI